MFGNAGNLRFLKLCSFPDETLETLLILKSLNPGNWYDNDEYEIKMMFNFL